MRLSDYEKITTLDVADQFILDTASGTKNILAKDLAKSLPELLTPSEFMEKLDIPGLPSASNLGKQDALLVGTATGNKKIIMSDSIFEMLDPAIPVETRRNIWRGKSLGLVVTDEQWANIAAGNFRGMFLGDYWEIGGRIWRIMDFDYWWNCGDTACKTHHLVIMPDSYLYTAKMNDTNITTGGYMGSKMYTENLTNAKSIVNGAFGSDHILNHREVLCNAVTDGHQSGGIWTDSTVEIPNEIMMYGSYIFAAGGIGTFVPYLYTINKSQLAGMKSHPRMINPNRETIWLRDVVSPADFALVGDYGGAGYYGASSARGVRVVFGIK